MVSARSPPDERTTAPSPQATRVESLFLLVKDGSSAQIRENAAEKLGEIALQSPVYCRSILRQIRALIVDQDWDVRVAAAKCLDVVARSLQTTPSSPIDANVALQFARASFAGQEASCPRLNFRTVDIDLVLRDGAPLLRSGGEEYQYESNVSEDQRRVQAVRQRQLLLRRICGASNASLWRTTEDSLAQQMLPRLNSEHVKELAEDMEANDLDVKSEPTMEDTRKRAVEMLPAQPRANKKLKGDGPEEEDAEEEPQRRGHGAIVALLVSDLLESVFDAQWEVRHGGVAALRHIFLSSGLISGLRRHRDQLAAVGATLLIDQWLEESLVRCLCVLALDQFVDYSADGSVAPVRELTAQVLGILLGSLQDPQLLHAYLSVLRKLLGATCWHTAHGGLLGIKFLIQAHAEQATQLVPMVIHDVIDALDAKRSDSEDDLLVVASGLLGDVLPYLDLVEASTLQAAMRSLWTVITTTARTRSSLVSSTAIQTLQKWYTHQPLASALAGHLDPDTMWNNLVFIAPLIHHHERSVRISAISCTEAVASQQDDQATTAVDQTSVQSVLRYLLPRLLLQILRDEVESVRDALQLTWKALVGWCASVEILATAVEDQLPQWIQLLWSLDTVQVLQVHPERDVGGLLQPGESLSSISIPSKDNLAARVAFGDAIGVLLAHLPIHSVGGAAVERIKTALDSFSGDQQCGALLVLARWAVHANSSSESSRLANIQFLRDHFGETLAIFANHDWRLPRPTASSTAELYYSEQVPSLQRVARMHNRLVEIFASVGIAVETSGTATASPWAAGRSRQIAESVTRYPFSQLSSHPQAFEQAHFSRQDLFLVDDGIQQAWSTSYARIQGVGSGAFCELLAIPPRQSGFLVKALMESIKTEHDPTFRRLTAETLARFVVSQMGVQRKCVAKIIANLTNSAVALAYREHSEPAPPATNDDAVLQSLRVRIQGAETTLQAIAQACGSLDKLPVLPEIATRGWNTTSEEAQWTDQLVQENAHLVSVLAASLPRSAKHHALRWISQLTDLVGERFQVNHTRQAVAQAIANVCSSLEDGEQAEAAMVQLYEKLFSVSAPDAEKPSTRDARLVTGAIMVLDRLVATCGSRLTPYVPSLLHYAMKAMHADDPTVRSLAAKSFADLVQLLPLEMDLQVQLCSPVREPALVEQVLRANEASRGFLDGLLRGHAIGAVDVCGVLAPAVALRGYQQHGVNWLNFLVENRMGGVLADDMGLGKTLQVLATIAARVAKKTTGAISLVVCPPIIVHHWMAEAKRCFPGVFTHVVDYSGPVAARKALLSNARKASTPTLLVATYSAVRADREQLANVPLGFVVLDEAHLIRNPKSSLFAAVCALRASHRFVLSGTPLQNHAGDLWSLFSFLMPGYLGEYAAFRRDVELPISRSRERNATPKQKEQAALAINSLHQRVLPFILRRTKDQVLTELPPKIISNILLPLTPLQQRLYKAASRPAEEEQEQEEETGAAATKKKRPLPGVLRNLQLLKKICVHPALVKHDVVTMAAATPSETKSLSHWKHSGKMVGLHDLLVESCDLGRTDKWAGEDDYLPGGTHRCLVFAHLKETLNLIQDMLARALPKVTHLRLDGSTAPSKRQQIVTAFNDDPSIDLLLLTTAVGGLGLTLTGADTVIFVEHSWNPFVDLQAMDRAHRIGQKKTVRVFRLIMEGSLEEHILDLQAFKEQVAHTVVTSTEASTSMNANTKNVLHLLQTSSTAVKAQEAAEAANAESKANSRGEHDVVGIPGVAVELLNQLGELWDRSQYDSLAFPAPQG